MLTDCGQINWFRSLEGELQFFMLTNSRNWEQKPAKRVTPEELILWLKRKSKEKNKRRGRTRRH